MSIYLTKALSSFLASIFFLTINEGLDPEKLFLPPGWALGIGIFFMVCAFLILGGELLPKGIGIQKWIADGTLYFALPTVMVTSIIKSWVQYAGKTEWNYQILHWGVPIFFLIYFAAQVIMTWEVISEMWRQKKSFYFRIAEALRALAFMLTVAAFTALIVNNQQIWAMWCMGPGIIAMGAAFILDGKSKNRVHEGDGAGRATDG
jgi:hypothetical protein